MVSLVLQGSVIGAWSYCGRYACVLDYSSSSWRLPANLAAGGFLREPDTTHHIRVPVLQRDDHALFAMIAVAHSAGTLCDRCFAVVRRRSEYQGSKKQKKKTRKSRPRFPHRRSAPQGAGLLSSGALEVRFKQINTSHRGCDCGSWTIPAAAGEFLPKSSCRWLSTRTRHHSSHSGACGRASLAARSNACLDAQRDHWSVLRALQRHVFRSRALMTCTLARPQRRARIVLSETFYVPPGQDPCHLVRQLQHEQLQNHSYSVLYQQAPARLQATPRRQKQHTLLISQPVQRRLI